jgi:hypothetical protein
MTKIKRFKEDPWQEVHHKLTQSPTSSQHSSKTQEVNHTTNLQRVRTIVRKEASKTRPKAIKVLLNRQTIDLTTVTDSSNSNNNSW